METPTDESSPPLVLGTSTSMDIVSNVADLEYVIGQQNFKFFAKEHERYISQKDLRGWGLSGEAIARWKEGGLQKPFRGGGGMKTYPINEILRFLYQSRSAPKYRLDPIRASVNLLEVVPGLECPDVGVGRDEDDPVWGILDVKSGRIQIPVGIDATSYVFVALLVSTKSVAEIIPGYAALPADPIDGIRVLIEHFGVLDEVRDVATEYEGLLDVLNGDSGGALLGISKDKLIVVATKLAGSEASFIQKCIFLAVLAASLPWEEGSFVDFINTLIVQEHGQKLSSAAIYSRIALVRIHLILKAQTIDLPLPETTAIANDLRKVADRDLLSVWQSACANAKANRRKTPNQEDCIVAWKRFSARFLACDDSEINEVDFTVEEDDIKDKKAKAMRSEIGKALNEGIEDTGFAEPQDALEAYLKQLRIGKKASGILMRELLG